MVVDDEPRARSRMRRLLQVHDDLAVVGEAGDGDQALRVVLESKPDVIFLDVDMPGTTGIQLATRIRDYLPESVRPLVVFTTAHAEHAVQAFQLESLDYLLKPVERDRLADCLRRVRKAIWATGRVPSASPPPEVAALEGHHGSSIEAVPIGSIAVLAVEEGVVFATTDTGERHRMSPSLGELEGRVPSPPFLRVSRGAIVNVERVDKLVSTPDGWVVRLDAGIEVKVSRRRLKGLRDALQL